MRRARGRLGERTWDWKNAMRDRQVNTGELDKCFVCTHVASGIAEDRCLCLLTSGAWVRWQALLKLSEVTSAPRKPIYAPKSNINST